MSALVFQNVAAFCDEYVPLAYTIEGLLRTSSLYSLTGRTGAGKTAFNVVAALAVATGRKDILGLDVTKGRVAYIACENPDDVRMRFKIAAFTLNVDLDALGDQLVILKSSAKPEEIVDELKKLAETEPFQFVIIETFVAFFDGDNINDPLQTSGFMRRLRPLTAIPGRPTVVVSCHPVKNAGEEQLVPYGSGAILNEVDGNLTLWKTDSGVALHWQGKLRGVDFAPLRFRFEILGSPDILDVKERQVKLPILRSTSDADTEYREKQSIDVNAKLLRAIQENPRGTQGDWALAIGRSKSNVNVRLKKLSNEKVVELMLGTWTITAKGKRALKRSPQDSVQAPEQTAPFV